MKAALGSVAFLVAMLLVLLIGIEEDSGGLFVLAIVVLGALSIACAAVAVVGARSEGEDWRGPMTGAIALSVLVAFVLAVVAIFNSIGDGLG